MSDRAPATFRGAVLLLTSLLAVACTVSEPTPESVVSPSPRADSPSPAPSGLHERDGLVLEADIRATTTELIADVVVRNERAVPAHLVPDPCGRVAEVLLIQTAFQPDGHTWDGSLQAVKDLIVRDQVASQGPDRFYPPIPPPDADFASFCQQPEAPIALAPGEERTERWSLPLSLASALDEVGSEGSLVRVEVVEARSADELEFLNVLSWVDADGERAGRNLRVERPAAEIIRPLPSETSERPSRAELFDELVGASPELRAWIEAQPADGWREADLTPAMPDWGAEFLHHRLRLLTAEFERAATVLATPDGVVVSLDLPGLEDLTRQFARSPTSLPPGIGLIPEPDPYVLTENLHLPDLVLPSGGLVVGEYLLEADEGLNVETSVPPGRYPVHATLGRHADGDVRVAYATLVVSSQQTVLWEEAGSIAVDGGSTTFLSIEARDSLIAQFETDEASWERFWMERLFDSLIAHDYLATEMAVHGGVNLAHFSSGFGDGGYPVFIGYDAANHPTQIVVDFFLVHLDWPVGG